MVLNKNFKVSKLVLYYIRRTTVKRWQYILIRGAGYSASRWMFGTLVTEKNDGARLVQQRGVMRQENALMSAPPSATFVQQGQPVPFKVPRMDPATLTSHANSGLWLTSVMLYSCIYL